MSETDSFARNQSAAGRKHSGKLTPFTPPGLDVAAVLVIATAGGCAMPPLDAETAEYNRVDTQLEAIDEYEALARACRAAGGTVYIDRDGGALAPRVSEIRSARCAEPVSSL